MSKERELLKKVLLLRTCDVLIPEIEQLLAQPEQEPVAWMYDLEISTHPDRDKIYHYNELSIIAPEIRGQQDAVNIRPLYLAPPTREPLSEDQMFHHWLYLEEREHTYLNFTDGVKYAEEQHGIGAEL